MSRTLRCLVTALLAVAPSLLTAQQEQPGGPRPSAAELTALVDSVVRSSLLAQGVPGATAAIMRGDDMLVQRGWGRADVISGRPADAGTIYALGSTSKQFTAVLVLRLVERGGLRLDDSIAHHLSDLRPEWSAITIEQLLNHTSGLQRGGFVDMSRIEEEVRGDSIIARAARDTMAAPPGTAYLYSNTGYVILGVLIEKLYGRSYAAVLRDEISRPLGLTALQYCGDAEAGRRAVGYRLETFDGSLSSPAAVHPSQQLGAGGICSNAGDLARWNRALHGGQVLSESSYRAMTTPRGAAVAQGYGFGLSVGLAPWGGPARVHGGQSVTGFTSENGWYPSDSLSVTILYNAYPRVAPGGTHVIAALALGHTPPSPRDPALEPVAAAAPAAGIVGEEARRQFVGQYQLQPGVVFRVDFEDGAFVLTPPRGDRTPMVHATGATYAIGSLDSGTTLTFLADEEGWVVGFLARQEGAPDRRLRKIR